MQWFIFKRLWGKTVVTLNMFFIRNNFPAFKIVYQMSKVFIIIKMCCVYSQLYDISCATLCIYMYRYIYTHTYIYIYIYIHIGCPSRNAPVFGRVFLILKYTEITENSYAQIWTVTEIMAREFWNYDSCYTLVDYQVHIKLAGICGFCNFYIGT
jgi:hypothetical protein